MGHFLKKAKVKPSGDPVGLTNTPNSPRKKVGCRPKLILKNRVECTKAKKRWGKRGYDVIDVGLHHSKKLRKMHIASGDISTMISLFVSTGIGKSQLNGKVSQLESYD